MLKYYYCYKCEQAITESGLVHHRSHSIVSDVLSRQELVKLGLAREVSTDKNALDPRLITKDIVYINRQGKRVDRRTRGSRVALEYSYFDRQTGRSMPITTTEFFSSMFAYYGAPNPELFHTYTSARDGDGMLAFDWQTRQLLDRIGKPQPGRSYFLVIWAYKGAIVFLTTCTEMAYGLKGNFGYSSYNARVFCDKIPDGFDDERRELYSLHAHRNDYAEYKIYGDLLAPRAVNDELLTTVLVTLSVPELGREDKLVVFELSQEEEQLFSDHGFDIENHSPFLALVTRGKEILC